MEDTTGYPDDDILTHFAIKGPAIRLPGGQNTSWIADQVVLKPAGSDALEEWMGSVYQFLSKRQLGFRTANPLQVDDRFTYKGWTAMTLLSGVEDTDLHVRLPEIKEASLAMHSVLATFTDAEPTLLRDRRDRWAYADRFAWDEPTDDMTMDQDFYKAKIKPCVDRLKALKSNIEVVKCQLVHGDLSGNILFEAGENPAILDFSLYWRPVEYAEAIVLADGLTWQNFTIDAVKSFGWDKYRFQMLVRALIFRIVTFAIDFDEGFVQKNWRVIDAERAVKMLEDNLI